MANIQKVVRASESILAETNQDVARDENATDVEKAASYTSFTTRTMSEGLTLLSSADGSSGGAPGEVFGDLKGKGAKEKTATKGTMNKSIYGSSDSYGAYYQSSFDDQN